jgi:hypothetical protein
MPGMMKSGSRYCCKLVVAAVGGVTLGLHRNAI